jgi:hypothetical protein
MPPGALGVGMREGSMRSAAVSASPRGEWRSAWAPGVEEAAWGSGEEEGGAGAGAGAKAGAGAGAASKGMNVDWPCSSVPEAQSA